MNKLLFSCGMLLASLGMNLAVSAAETAPECGWVLRGKRYYYVQEDGTEAVGETEIDGTPYLFAPNGALQTGWQTVGDKRYFYEPDGTPVFGWLDWRGERYYISKELGKLTSPAEDAAAYQFAETGEMLHDTWVTAEDGSRYYLYAEGLPLKGQMELDGTKYYFDPESGALLRWMQDGMGFDADGQPLEGICAFDAAGRERYGFRGGEMLTGEQVFDEGIRDFGEDGIMLTGWDIQWDYYPERKNILGADSARRRYYDLETGLRVTGWYDGFYFDPETGEAVTGFRELDGKKLHFTYGQMDQSQKLILDDGIYIAGEDGEILTGYLAYSGFTYYLEADGRAHLGWRQINDRQREYYRTDSTLTEPKGAMVRGTVMTIDGKEYEFDADGIYTEPAPPVKICLDAGHYGKYNRSPVNSAYYESDFTWKMHLYLKEELEHYGFEVVTTREDKDTDLYVEDRGRLAEGCDLFISIHSNATTGTAVDGPLACCPINGCADKLGLDLANLVADVMQTSQRGSIWKREGLRGDWYGVLRGATAVGVPAILLEHSYHTNPRATAWLLVDENVRKLAKAEAVFLARWFHLIE